MAHKRSPSISIPARRKATECDFNLPVSYFFCDLYCDMLYDHGPKCKGKRNQTLKLSKRSARGDKWIVECTACGTHTKLPCDETKLYNVVAISSQ
jgi:hypothetical protein